MAACTAQSAVAIISKNYRVKNKGLLELLRYISGVDGAFALFFFTIGISIIAGGNDHFPDAIQSLRWLLISILAGVVPGLILIVLSRTRFTSTEYIVFVLGTILFCGGLAFQLRVLPLVSGFICGVFTANFCRHRLRALSIVVRSEKSIYIILLLLIGAIFEFKPGIPLILIGVYIVVRVLGKMTGVFTATKIFRPRYPVPPSFGLSLVAEGGVAAAIVLDTTIFFPDSNVILIPVLIASLFINELIAPRFILRHLAGVGAGPMGTAIT